jgi:hypothetical protein
MERADGIITPKVILVLKRLSKFEKSNHLQFFVEN